MHPIPADSNLPQVVVLGGGNGTSRLLQTLAPLLTRGDLSALNALVLNADDGGSTGRLREQYGVSAMGDFTKCLMALSGFHNDVRGEQFLRALDHRFESGDFKGHTVRNIFLTALEQTSDLDAGIAMMARLLQIPKYAGVVPLTLEALHQKVFVERNGKQEVIGEGQFNISHSVHLQAADSWQPGDVKVTFGEQSVGFNPRAKQLLEESTHIIVAPGHTYGTILPALALPDLAEQITASRADLIAVMPLLTTPRHTTGWSGEDFIRVYESYLGRPVDIVIANNGTAPIELVEGQGWVEFTESDHSYELIVDDVVLTETQKVQKSDVVPRAIAVHDANKLSTHIHRLVHV